MGSYNFDRRIDRKGTSCIKYDGGSDIVGRDDLLPMWVADMDFALPQDILDRIKNRIDHGIFGYTMIDQHYRQTVTNWFKRRYQWEMLDDWISVVPGVVYGLTCAVRAVTRAEDAVMIQEPVYYPFRSVVESNNRICINNQLRYVADRSSYAFCASWNDTLKKPVFNGPHYEIDFDDFESKIKEHHVKALILCSPHNPVGRVWTEEELKMIRDICERYQVFVIADEIHCDFVFKRDFVSFGQTDRYAADHAIVCTAPSKTFNIAGLQASNIIIPDRDVRQAFNKESERNGFGGIGPVSKTAVEAVYEMGDEWLDELIAYLQENVKYIRDYLVRNIPQVRMIEPEGTYLVWLDFSRVADGPEQMKEMIQDDARLWLDNGAMFSQKTWMFERMNIACPLEVLKQAMHQLEAGVKKRLDNCYSTEWIMEWYRSDQ